MRFYLGTHHPNWLEQVSVPMFVSHTRLPKKDYVPTCDWALDSGGFTQLHTHGRWTFSEADYLRTVERVREWPGFQWAAPMDWMTEPYITAKTGLTVEDHQRLTVENFVRLDLAMPGTFIPVLQGQSVGDYLKHWRMYDQVGVELLAASTVGLGSVCRRSATGEIEDIVLSLAPLRLHGFGCKASALARVGHLLHSADSMAWSYGGRMNGPCKPNGCGNHLHYALEWRERTLKERAMQEHLW